MYGFSERFSSSINKPERLRTCIRPGDKTGAFHCMIGMRCVRGIMISGANACRLLKISTAGIASIMCWDFSVSGL